MLDLRKTTSFGRLIFGLLGVLLLAMSAGLNAAPARAQQPDANFALTEPMVAGFITSYPAVQALGETFRERYGLPEGDDPASGWQAFMAYRDAMSELDGVVAAHGFAGFGDWIQAATAIAMAYAFAEDGGGMDSEMAAAIADIRNNPDIPAAQKEMLLQQFQAQAQMLSSIRPPQANLDAVNAHAAELKALFDN